MRARRSCGGVKGKQALYCRSSSIPALRSGAEEALSSVFARTCRFHALALLPSLRCSDSLLLSTLSSHSSSLRKRPVDSTTGISSSPALLALARRRRRLSPRSSGLDELDWLPRALSWLFCPAPASPCVPFFLPRPHHPEIPTAHFARSTTPAGMCELAVALPAMLQAMTDLRSHPQTCLGTRTRNHR